MNGTLLGALELGGIKALMTVEGGVERAVFGLYGEPLFLPHLKPGQVGVMDHLKAHKVQGIVRALEKGGALV